MPRNNPIFSELGVTALSRFGGTVTEEFLPELRGNTGRRTLKQMSSTDPTIGALLFAVDQMVMSADWEIRPASKDSSKEAKDAAEFIESCLNDMSRSWSSTISSICSMFIYGWDYKEICYKRRNGKDSSPTSQYSDGMIGLDKLADRSQLSLDEWVIDTKGEILGLYQIDPNTARRIFIPSKKALLFRTTDRLNSPEGKPIIANAYIPWYYLKNIRELEGIGIERDLVGIAYIRVPAEILTNSEYSTQLTEYKNLVSNIRKDEQAGILLPIDPSNPDAYKLELIGSPGQKQYDVDKVIARYKAEIAQVALGDFILMGHQSSGSFALSRSKGDAFNVAIHGWLDIIAGVLNTNLIPKLIELNPQFSGLERYPVAVHNTLKVPSFEEVNGLIRALAFAKVSIASDIGLLNSILESYGLPKLSDEQFEDVKEMAEEKKPIQQTNIDGVDQQNHTADPKNENRTEDDQSGREGKR